MGIPTSEKDCRYIKTKLLFLGKGGLLKGIGSMMMGPRGRSGQASKGVSLVEVVKQATKGSKLKDVEEDIMVMDTKLKIIEILQVRGGKIRLDKVNFIHVGFCNWAKQH